jgi:hypothetical protein
VTTDLFSPDDVMNLLISQGFVERSAERYVQNLAYAANLSLHGLDIDVPEPAYQVARVAVGHLLETLGSTEPRGEWQ